MSNKRSRMELWVALILAIVFVFSGMAYAQTKAPAKAPEPVKIDLNKATVEQLTKCPGLNPTLAKAIIDYRTKNGPFKKPEDLLKVQNVTKAIMNKLNPKVENNVIFVTPAKAAPVEEDNEEEPSLKPSKC